MTAHELADQAAEVAAKMKPGTWDAVQALALVSIAQSLATIADQHQCHQHRDVLRNRHRPHLPRGENVVAMRLASVAVAPV